MVHNIFVGRRKTAVARAYLKAGAGNITVNGKDVSKYFPTEMLLEEVRQPLTVTETNDRYDVHVRVRGGGSHGQAGAVKMSIARALVAIDEEFRPRLRAYRLLTRDSRMVERKKYGQKKARKRFQFSKR